MDLNKQGIQALAAKQGKEWATFSAKIIFETIEEKLRINSTGSFRICMCACTRERKYKIYIDITQTINKIKISA